MTDQSSRSGIRSAGKRVICIVFAVLMIAAAAGCSSTEELNSSLGAAAAHLNQYRDYEELSEALGFDMTQIAGAGFVAERYALIDGDIGEIIYRTGDVTVNLRMSKGTNDISGVGVSNYTTKEIQGNEIHLGSYGDIQVAWFLIGGYDYALSAVGMTPTQFSSFVDELVAGVLPR